MWSLGMSSSSTKTPARPKARKGPLTYLLGKFKHNLSLLANSDQGRTFHLVSKDHNSNMFIKNGGGMSFSCYRFAIKGRLNLLPTKVVARRIGIAVPDTLCPKCKEDKG